MLQESDLSDGIIDEAVNTVERQVIKRIPTYADLSSEDRELLEDGVINLVCSELCHVLKVRIPVREEGNGGKFEFRIDWDRLADKFKNEGEEIISSYEEITFSGHLILAGPQR